MKSLRYKNKDLVLQKALNDIALKIKSPNEAIKELEDSELFLFHGSPRANIKELKPRQAYNRHKPDGPPAVFATYESEAAIFKSIITGRGHGGWNCTKEDFIEYGIEKKDYLKFFKGKALEGYLYVLDRSKFRKDRKRGFISERPVKILSEIVVTEKEMPKYTILEEDDFDRFYER